MTPLARARRASRRLAVRSSWLRCAADLGEHRGQAAAAQSLLEDPERLARPADADDDQLPRIEAETIEADAIGKPRLADGGGFDHPEDRPVVFGGETGEDRGGKAGRGRGVAGRLATDFMERIAAEAAGEHAVEGSDSEGKHHPAPPWPERKGWRRGGPAAVGAILVPSGIAVAYGLRREAPTPDLLLLEANGTALDRGDLAPQSGKPIPCHESAGAHGFSSPRSSYVPVLFSYRFRRTERESRVLARINICCGKLGKSRA